MNQSEFEFRGRGGGVSQCERIRERLQAAAGQWVAMTDLWKASGAFAVHSRVADLRKRGLAVEHRNERREDGAILSFYRLQPGHQMEAAQ